MHYIDAIPTQATRADAEQVATYCLALVGFGLVSYRDCLQLLNSHEGLSRHRSTRGLGCRLKPMLAVREAQLASLAPAEEGFSHFTPLGILSVAWPFYLQNLAACQEPLTEVPPSAL